MNIDQYPVLEIIGELKTRLDASPLVILQAPPGAGKSTLVPLKLYQEQWLSGKKIIMLEPRRLAAKAVAERMADLMDEPAGKTVGFRIRFETNVSSVTRIEVVTEGILTRMLQHDNSLEEAGLIIFDEFHERSLHADLALALTLQSQQVLRPDLKLLIMSATLDANKLSGLLGNAPVVTSKGRQYPVTINYLPQDSDQPVWQKVVSAIRKAFAQEQGDVLVFLPGSGEIKRVEQALESAPLENAVVFPLYGDLNYKKQQEAILPNKHGRRKIVLATSIAETSLTIEGISVVIDGGLSRVPRFDIRSGFTRLETVRVTKDAADQRAGRAGRLGPGVCYRLWTQGVHLSLAEQRRPEILEADLAPLMLDLLQWGVRNVADLTWVTPPPPGAVSQALDLLKTLEAIDDKGITARGKEMLRLPTHPRIAHMLLVSADDRTSGAAAAGTDMAAILEERDPLSRDAGADLTLRIQALRKWRSGERTSAERSALERIERVAANWRKIQKIKEDNASVNDFLIGKILWAAYPERLAQRQGKNSSRYKLQSGRIVALPEHDPLSNEEWICAALLDAGVGEGKVFLAAAVDFNDLKQLAKEQSVVRWDDDRGTMVSLVEKRIGPLLIESRNSSAALTDTERLRLIREKLISKGFSILGDNEKREAIESRIISLHHWRVEEGWPLITEDYLLQHLEDWLGPFISGINKLTDLARLDVDSILKAMLPWELQSKLDTLAPEKIPVPSGSLIRLRYFQDGSPPVLEVRLQEMFGLADTPTVNGGLTKVRLHLLSPGFKPVQVTQDLRSFWQTTYHEVRKQLRLRYPRHHWPEDPWTAEAVRGARRRSP
jgi:ATP-dependent helicase HrpB